MRYANNSNYKNDEMITREVFVSQSLLDEVKRIVVDSEVRPRTHLWSSCAAGQLGRDVQQHLTQAEQLLQRGWPRGRTTREVCRKQAEHGRARGAVLTAGRKQSCRAVTLRVDHQRR